MELTELFYKVVLGLLAIHVAMFGIDLTLWSNAFTFLKFSKTASFFSPRLSKIFIKCKSAHERPLAAKKPEPDFAILSSNAFKLLGTVSLYNRLSKTCRTFSSFIGDLGDSTKAPSF